jgi:ribose 5-phosphate isomerase RpiB
MSGNMFRSQTHLEKRVSQKTKKLENSHKSMALLYHLVKKLNEFSEQKQDYGPILTQLAEVTGVKDLDLCIMTASGQAPYEHLLSTDKTLPEKCIEQQCGECTDHDLLFPQLGSELKYPLVRGEKNFGVLVCNSFVGTLAHSNIKMRLGFLNYIFNTPELHRWHHSNVITEGNRNYGLLFAVWDHVFGTYFKPNRRPSESIGSKAYVPDSLIKQCYYPFVLFLKKNTKPWDYIGEKKQTKEDL